MDNGLAIQESKATYQSNGPSRESQDADAA